MTAVESKKRQTARWMTPNFPVETWENLTACIDRDATKKALRNANAPGVLVDGTGSKGLAEKFFARNTLEESVATWRTPPDADSPTTSLKEIQERGGGFCHLGSSSGVSAEGRRISLRRSKSLLYSLQSVSSAHMPSPG